MAFDPKPILDTLGQAGNATSEFAAFKSADKSAKIMMAIGAVTMIGSTIAAAFGQDTKIGIIAGLVVACLGKIVIALQTLGYLKSRTDVKGAEAAVKEAAVTPAAVVTGPPAP